MGEGGATFLPSPSEPKSIGENHCNYLKTVYRIRMNSVLLTGVNLSLGLDPSSSDDDVRHVQHRTYVKQ